MEYLFGSFFLKNYIKIKFKKYPIIIGGCPRSGTTLLLSILGSHRNIFSIDYETASLYPSIKPYKLLFVLLFDKKNNCIRKISRTKTRFCEKSPKNFYHTKEINELFHGEVKFINLLRDGRDVITSKHPSSPNKYYVGSEVWIRDVKKCLEVEAYENVLSVKYEDLITRTEETLKKICYFIGEDFDKNMIEYQKFTNVKSDIAWDHQARPIHKVSIKKWENPEHKKVVSDFMANTEAKKLMNQLGYIKDNELLDSKK